MASVKVNVGAALRPAFRRLCGRLDLTFVEYPGFIESLFVVSGSPSGIRIIRDKISDMEQEDADQKAAELLAKIEKRQRRANRWYRRVWRTLMPQGQMKVPTYG